MKWGLLGELQATGGMSMNRVWTASLPSLPSPLLHSYTPDVKGSQMLTYWRLDPYLVVLL